MHKHQARARGKTSQQPFLFHFYAGGEAGLPGLSVPGMAKPGTLSSHQLPQDNAKTVDICLDAHFLNVAAACQINIITPAWDMKACRLAGMLCDPSWNLEHMFSSSWSEWRQMPDWHWQYIS